MTSPVPAPVLVTPTNTKAVLALIFAFIFWPAAIVLGHLAHSEIKRTGERGRGFATAGLILGYLGMAFVALLVVITAAAASAVPPPGYPAPSLSSRGDLLPDTVNAPSTRGEVALPDSSTQRAYLADLRASEVPVSTTGTPDVLIGVGICQQLAVGTSPDQLITDLNSMLAPLYGIDGYYHAVNTVNAAERILCPR